MADHVEDNVAQFMANRDSLIDFLQLLADNPALANDDLRLKSLVAKINKNARKQHRSTNSKAVKQADQAKKAQSQLFQLNDERAETRQLSSSPSTSPSTSPALTKAQHCYICKAPYQQLHFFYHQLCPACAATNYAYREKSCDLTGRYALITGGRIKIGYEIALRLLRWGAHVIVTSRFPQNTLSAYKQEPDFDTWSDRLDIYGIDLRNLASLDELIAFIKHKTPALDILINNAAQTIRRPIAFYKELLSTENQNLLLTGEKSNLPIINSAYFPPNQKDIYGQQTDLRENNSWIQPLEDVDLREMLEVQLVNVTAPFLLNSKLKDHMIQAPAERKFIVNVSAVEGQFNRSYKSANHPHTNMAKASLNMMTRTSAEAYAKAGIYMTSVDTGWITDENPAPLRERMRDRGFVPPLDIVDGAVRVLAPIIDGVNSAEEPVFGVFLKDYRIADW